MENSTCQLMKKIKIVSICWKLNGSLQLYQNCIYIWNMNLIIYIYFTYVLLYTTIGCVQLWGIVVPMSHAIENQLHTTIANDINFINDDHYQMFKTFSFSWIFFNVARRHLVPMNSVFARCEGTLCKLISTRHFRIEMDGHLTNWDLYIHHHLVIYKYFNSWSILGYRGIP